MGLKDIFKKSSSTTVPGKVKSFLNKDSTKAALSFTGIVASAAIEVFCSDNKNKHGSYYDMNEDMKTNDIEYIDSDGVARNYYDDPV